MKRSKQDKKVSCRQNSISCVRPTDVICLSHAGLQPTKNFKAGKEINAWGPALPLVNPRQHSWNKSSRAAVNEGSISAHEPWEAMTTGRTRKHNTRVSFRLLETLFQRVVSEKTCWCAMSYQHCQTIRESLLKRDKVLHFDGSFFS